ILNGFGPTSRPTGNGNGGFVYNQENEINYQVSDRFLSSATANYFPADWVTFDGTLGYDNRTRNAKDFFPKGYRTTTVNTAANFGNANVSNRREEALNTAIGAPFRHQFSADLNAKLQTRGTFEEDVLHTDVGRGQQFVVK